MGAAQPGGGPRGLRHRVERERRAPGGHRSGPRGLLRCSRSPARSPVRPPCSTPSASTRFRATPGLGLEMQVIAAVIVGGTSVTGGRGTVAGTLLGVILLGMIGPALTFLGISAYWERAIQGGIILAAVAIDAVADGETMQASLPLIEHRSWRERCVPQRRMGAAAGAGRRDRGLLRAGRELLLPRPISSRWCGSAWSWACWRWR